jgi:2-methylisocitrate lyase-like PEP mutase family enzyme
MAASIYTRTPVHSHTWVSHMPTQTEKARTFRALHERKQTFIIPNPWDVGSAKILEHMGFEALATTSMGFAFSIGKQDGDVDRDMVMKHISELASATELPVSADLENGFGDAPETAAETIRLAAAAGAVGGSIEDTTGRADNPFYDMRRAAERVGSVDRPVNVIMGLRGVQLGLAELSQLGVRRISVGSALARTALGAFLHAAREMKEHGTFNFAADAVNPREINAIFHP